MKDFLKKYKFVVLFSVLVLSACENNNSKILDNEKKPIESFCKKEDNCCIKDKDCSFIWYTGGCFTMEYVLKKQEEAKKGHGFIGEAPKRDDVKITCSCENNKCISHEEKIKN